MFRGVATVNYFADDVDACVEWYSEVLGVEPYFRREFEDGVAAYVEFRIGDRGTELGILNRRYLDPAVGGAVLYWAVDDVRGAYERLLAMGAREHQGVVERGVGFVTASVTDPFGNVLGVMFNQHYLDGV